MQKPSPSFSKTAWLERALRLILLLALAAGAAAAPGAAPTGVSAAAEALKTYQGLWLDGANDYVTFGAAPALGAAAFTLEVWFRKLGTGTLHPTTGTGGLANVIPLLTKGRDEAENAAVDMNYFMGLDSSGRLVADFEEAPTGASPGLNHPVTGVRAVTDTLWHHAAATYDGLSWRLYLDGVLDQTLAVGRPPNAGSTQHAALGTCINSTGTASGFFNGQLDEARIWNYARSQVEIQAAMSSELSLPQSGLIGYWNLNAGAGASAADSSPSGMNGTLTNGPLWSSGFSDPSTGLLLVTGDGSNDYLTFGAAPGLGAAAFTLETWFRKLGAGVTTGTGTGGVTAVPLITKGRGEADGSNLDMNYFFGLNTGGQLVADFEEGLGGSSPGLNHPVTGVNAVTDDRWHHAAVTYDGASWRLYLDGSLDKTLLVGQPPRSDSLQHAGLGTALTSTGVAAGFFHGMLDEARIWNYARSQAEIQAAMYGELNLPQSGLLGYWRLNETSGTTAYDGSTSAINGAYTGLPRRTGGRVEDSTPPSAPGGLSALGRDGRLELSWTPSAESDLAGYNLYRALVSPVVAGSVPLNGSTPLTAPVYTDSSLQNGLEYIYALEAVDQSGNRSALSAEVSAAPGAPGATALLFNGSSAYVDFGNPAKLHLPVFTLETWFRWDGAGATTTTGTGGIDPVVPLLARGRGESEDPAVDLNYFLGIDAALGVLAADFEEGAGGASPSLNHPVRGATPVTDGLWHHAAASYDGSTWKLYLDGKLDGQALVGQPPAAAGNQYASIGSALTSTGAAQGFFNGAIDEARIWNRPLSQDEVNLYMNEALQGAPLALASGLVARWGMNEGSGELLYDSRPLVVDGHTTGHAPAWTAGAPFANNRLPLAPLPSNPPPGSVGVDNPTNLSVLVDDLDGDNLTVSFYGRQVLPAAPSFYVIAIPDTQYYTVNAGGGAIFNSQTQWVVDNRAALNIAYVTHLGDITETGDNDTDLSEWTVADAAFDILEAPVDPFTEGVPYGLTPGNHDLTGGSTNFEATFGVSRFAGRPYYGGAYNPVSNRNSYTTFSSGGLDFMVINIDSNTTPSAEVLAWANGLLAANPTRRGIVNTHQLLSTAANPANFTTAGQVIYNALRGQPNLFLMLGGHVAGEGFRQDTYNGSTVYSILSDYQNLTNGGNGWLRTLRFAPAEDLVYVGKYSPYLGGLITEQYSLSYSMSGGTADAADAFQLLGVVSGVVPGGTAVYTWDPLTEGSPYEWYVTVDDSKSIRTSPTWGFTPGKYTAIELRDFQARPSLDTGALLVLAAISLQALLFALSRRRIDGD